MLNYFYSLKVDNLIYSVDMLRLSFFMSEEQKKELFKLIKTSTDLQYRHFSNINLFSYRDLFVFNVNQSSISVGVSLNTLKKSDSGYCFIEFNPNKVMPSKTFDFLFEFIRFNSKHLDLVRFDLSCDIPIRREYLRLVKDNRKFNLLVNSISNYDFSEYLGFRNTNGFIKLYNKTIESSLDYFCTRLEITLENFNYSNYLKVSPKIFMPKNINIFEFQKLKNTEIVILNYLVNDTLNCVVNFKMLGRKMQEKLKPYVFEDYTIPILSEYNFKKICDFIQEKFYIWSD